MFITFEGPEGSGKSTAIQSVGRALEDLGHRVVLTREPGSGKLGAAIRAILLDPSTGVISARAELFLFLADRAEHVASVIRPALARGDIVLCDRYIDSTTVYQGYARGLDLEELRTLNDAATGGLIPDLTLLLDVAPEIGLARQQNQDRLDRESIDFHRKVREGYLAEAAKSPRWKVIDASRAAEEVGAHCVEEVLSRLQIR